MFTYKAHTPNLFKASADRFYIYSDFIRLGPLTWSSSGSDAAAATLLFPKAFSRNTLDSYTYTFHGSQFDGQYQLVTGDNKVTGELFPASRSQNYFYN